ncbi:hypothetical protein [Streptomyces sp. NBC_01803]|uniref:hypothetical protein n=1 Tax=Streptomyces sp. NBC_01803 TaxID=2975946 RepID=UPI002DD7DFC9|nr:hypothetical protein [Streptomyces sp. NBC_01803]WSA45679.1 hypothetical protein OIE51_16610 [Streptomyces sp. NBC_01803]
MQNARAGLQVSDAVDELLSWEALTTVATVDATPEEVYDYLLRAGAGSGREPSMDAARLLADLELTVSVGDPEGETRMKDIGPDDPLNSAMTVNFGGRDIAGVKMLNGHAYARVGGQAIVEDVYGGDEAAVARAERFDRDAARLPAALATAELALRGEWVEVEPFAYEAYAEALNEHGDVDPATAEALAGVLTDGGAMLDPGAQWDLAGGLESTLRSGGSLRRTGEAHGADTVEVHLPAGEAYRALGPVLTLLTEQCERFGLPPVVSAPADPSAEVTAELAIRNGVLTNATFDLGQFGPEGAGSLPLNLFLAGGSALNLDPPETTTGPLTPADLTVALLYLAEQNESRAEDESRADVPGPIQP